MKAEWLDVGVTAYTLPGQSESGDLHVFEPYPGGVLLAAVDGIGHGTEAAVAARAATEVLARRPRDSVLSLIRECHKMLTATRGAAMSLASISGTDRTLTWLGVGNVEGVLVRTDKGISPPFESLLLRAGTVGGRLPSLSAAILPLYPGDILVFATDGVDAGFVVNVVPGASAQATAERILTEHRRGTDDALVLVARYVGSAP